MFGAGQHHHRLKPRNGIGDIGDAALQVVQKIRVVMDATRFTGHSGRA